MPGLSQIMQLPGYAEGFFSMVALMARRRLAVVNCGYSSRKGMAYCPGLLSDKSTFSVQSEEPYAVSVARTVARE